MSRCVSIEGVMRWPDKDLAKMFTDEGERRNGRTVRVWLKLQLAQGKRVLPLGKACDGFSLLESMRTKSGHDNAVWKFHVNPATS